jgi:hypothetical protein
MIYRSQTGLVVSPTGLRNATAFQRCRTMAIPLVLRQRIASLKWCKPLHFSVHTIVAVWSEYERLVTVAPLSKPARTCAKSALRDT